MSDPLMIAVGIIGDRELTDDVLAEVMATLAMLPTTRNADLDAVRRQIEGTIGVRMVPGEGLSDGERQPWVEDIKASTEWHYWDSYTKQLRFDGFASSVVRTLDEDTDNILTECGNPQDESGWRVQGLVMGAVQSGKTANYCGLVSKAADTGYKVIVLLTGMIEDLRGQTQARLDEGFVGRDSRELLKGESGNVRIGSGRFRTHVPNVLTSIDSDFLTANRSALRSIPLENITQPVLLVMKKNKTALENLISFLGSQLPKGASQLNLPLLLIDDEADNASVNVRKDENPATINRLIRELVAKFRRATYVAYTATPFANVFINPDPDRGDLFPGNFVYSLNAPTNYLGADSIFSDNGDHQDQLVDIDDAEDVFPTKHDRTLVVDGVPQSLEDAIGVFLLSCAIRDLRGEKLKHRSMLINVTRFTDVHRQISEVVKNHLYDLVEEVKQYLSDDDLWQRHASLVRLRELFAEHYSDCGSPWDDVRHKLYDSIASVKVLTINQRTDRAERLNYQQYGNSERGRRVIAIGGLTLSRGLTLEGLCVSYFYRNSKAYDTLLQMGRWFGYRSGYADLCRIWMAPEAQDWFSHIAEVVAELRSDFQRMHANHQPPSKFGIRVRSHPGALLVTAQNKMRSAEEVEISLSFSRAGIETPFLPRSAEANNRRAGVTSKFLQGLGAAGKSGNRFIWSGVSAEKIADFLTQLEISPVNSEFIQDLRTGQTPLISFIRNNDVTSLREWDVCVAPGDGSAAEGIRFVGPDGPAPTIRKRKRQFEKPSSRSADDLKVNKQRVGEIADEKVGLSTDQIQKAEEEWERADPARVGKRAPGSAYRGMRKHPLLTIHPLEPTDAKTEKSRRRILDPEFIEPKLLVAVSLSFPGFAETSATSVPYRLNRVYMQRLGLLEEEDDDEDQN